MNIFSFKRPQDWAVRETRSLALQEGPGSASAVGGGQSRAGGTLSLFSLSLSLSLSLSDAGHLGGPGQSRGSEMRVGLAEAWQVRSGRSGKV